MPTGRWLRDLAVDFQLCGSHRTLASNWNLRPATHGWMLDSGAYTELKDHSTWTVEPIRYAQDTGRFGREIGRLDWASIEDWMCEPWIIHGGWHDGLYYVGTGPVRRGAPATDRRELPGARDGPSRTSWSCPAGGPSSRTPNARSYPCCTRPGP